MENDKITSWIPCLYSNLLQKGHARDLVQIFYCTPQLHIKSHFVPKSEPFSFTSFSF